MKLNSKLTSAVAGLLLSVSISWGDDPESPSLGRIKATKLRAIHPRFIACFIEAQANLMRSHQLTFRDLISKVQSNEPNSWEKLDQYLHHQLVVLFDLNLPGFKNDLDDYIQVFKLKLKRLIENKKIDPTQNAEGYLMTFAHDQLMNAFDAYSKKMKHLSIESGHADKEDPFQKNANPLKIVDPRPNSEDLALKSFVVPREILRRYLIQVEKVGSFGVGQHQDSFKDYLAILNLYFVEGYSHREISQILKINETHSRTRLLKAKKAFVKWICKTEGIPVPPDLK